LTRDEFLAMLRDDHARIIAINQTKGHDYAGDRDALANFKRDNERIAKIAANDPVLLKWYVYFSKHLDAIFTFLEEGDVKSEPVDGRLDDAILYLHLLRGLIHEKRAPRLAAPAVIVK
jgi:hypothetical protein